MQIVLIKFFLVSIVERDSPILIIATIMHNRAKMEFGEKILAILRAETNPSVSLAAQSLPKRVQAAIAKA